MFIDFHAHIYPGFNLAISLDAALKIMPGQPKLILLTERSDCHYFSQLPSLLKEEPDISFVQPEAEYLILNSELGIFAGRQFQSHEGLELLSLFAAPILPDGLVAEKYVETIISAGGLVGFSWAFGKWFAKRGQEYFRLAELYGPKKIVLLDSRLRPSFLGLPKPMQELVAKGFKLLAGSDPLPLKCEEAKILSFGCNLSDCNLTAGLKRDLLQRIIDQNDFPLSGTRDGGSDFVIKQMKLRL